MYLIYSNINVFLICTRKHFLQLIVKIFYRLLILYLNSGNFTFKLTVRFTPKPL